MLSTQGSPALNFFDPNRPKTPTGAIALLCGIPAERLEIAPAGNGNVYISAWLPVEGEIFASKRFVCIKPTTELTRILTQYEADPERELERLFSIPTEAIRPNVRTLVRRSEASGNGASHDRGNTSAEEILI